MRTRRTWTGFLVFTIFGILFGACGGDNAKTLCQQADELRAAHLDAVCSPKPDACCPCRCWKLGQDYDDAAGCTCRAFAKPQPCQGVVLQAARECMNAAEDCKQAITNSIAAKCP